jgi:hypothetical protein
VTIRSEKRRPIAGNPHEIRFCPVAPSGYRLLGPAFGHDESLDDEPQQHAVSLWMLDDLVTAVEAEISTDECRSLLAPGRVMHALEGVLWEREHGRAERVAVIADLIARLGWQMQGRPRSRRRPGRRYAAADGGGSSTHGRRRPRPRRRDGRRLTRRCRRGASWTASARRPPRSARGVCCVTVAPRGESKREVSQSAATDGLAKGDFPGQGFLSMAPNAENLWNFTTPCC